MSEELNNAGQDDTKTAAQGNEEDLKNSGVGDDTNNVNATDGKDSDNADDADKDSGIGEKPETEEEKFTKEYIGKPEAGYDYKDVELPERMTLNEDLTKGLNEIAGKYNMSQKGANELMALGVKLTENAQKKFLEGATNQQMEKNNKFYDDLMADSEIGGNKWDEAKPVINQAYNAFIGADKEVHESIQHAGLLNNKTFLKVFYELGKLMQDGKIISGDSAVKKERTAEDFYPNMPKGRK